MGITKLQLQNIGFRPIDATHKSFARTGAYLYAHPYYDNLSVLAEDFYKVEVRQEPQVVDYDPKKDWTICYELDELQRALGTFTYYENWRKINGFDPVWGFTSDTFKW